MDITLIILLIIIGLLFISFIIYSLVTVIKDKTDDRPDIFTYLDQNKIDPIKKIGEEAEDIANSYLRNILDEHEYILTNILIPNKNGTTSEIDLVIISHKGLFCIEVKRWSGRISGDDEDEYWYQIYSDSIKNKKHLNPVIQNDRHCSKLEKLLNNKYQVDNIVIFVALENDAGIYSKFTYTLNSFKKYYQTLEDELDDKDIDYIASKLATYQATSKELKAHTERIKNTYNN